MLYAGVHNTCTTYRKKKNKNSYAHILMNKLITLIRLKFMEPELQYDLFSTQKNEQFLDTNIFYYGLIKQWTPYVVVHLLLDVV